MKRIVIQSTLSVLTIVGISFFALSTNTHTQNNDFEITKNYSIFSNMFREINTYYLKEIEPKKFIRTGIQAMLASLDPYTNFIPAEDVADFESNMSGKYGGIGALIRTTPTKVLVVDPYPGFPAYDAGLRAGDILLEIDGQNMKKPTLSSVSHLLRGAPGSMVTLKIKRPGKELPFELKFPREHIVVPNVPYSGMVAPHIAYIHLNAFSERAAANIKEALSALKAENDVHQVILDLRNNTGGLLTEAVNVANLFVPQGERIVQMRGKVRNQNRVFKTLNGALDADIPVAVLINSYSASASEIVAGALQDLDRGVLIGQRSYGKGLVQTTKEVGFNAKMKLTTAKYYIPSGRCIQATEYENGRPRSIPDSLRSAFKTKGGRVVYDGGGVKPDVEVGRRTLNPVTSALIRSNLFFDYATQYVLAHPSIGAASDFEIDDATYDDFVAFLEGKSYPYHTESEDALLRVERRAKAEHYYEAMKTELTQMHKVIDEDKKQDLYKYKSEIIKELAPRIVGRYYHVQGRIENALQRDEEVAKAIEILSNKAAYTGLLQAK